MSGNVDSCLVLRFADSKNYTSAFYSKSDKAIYIIDYTNGTPGDKLGYTNVDIDDSFIRLSVEMRGGNAIMKISSKNKSFTTPIVAIKNSNYGSIGLENADNENLLIIKKIVLKESKYPKFNANLERKLFDFEGRYRGNIGGGSWDDYAREKIILMDSYKPPKLPIPQDWVLVLERKKH